MNDALLARIARTAGVPDLVDVLSTRVEPTDLQSLLLEVYARLAGRMTQKRLLEQYESNRFVAPSQADPLLMVEIERMAWQRLPSGYRAIELAPLCPLGTNSRVATVSQNNVVSTIRNTEVVSDSTNVLALEAASRRRRLRQSADRRSEPVLLAASHRLTRAQVFTHVRSWSHFRVLCLCAAGRDEGAFHFEARQLTEHISYYIELLEAMAQVGVHLSAWRVPVTDFTGGSLTSTLEKEVLHPLATRFPHVHCYFDQQRTMGRGYYDGAAFKIYATLEGVGELELADGGPTSWTRQLLSDEKERLVVSGLGIERLCV